jgi:hypothetical protein
MEWPLREMATEHLAGVREAVADAATRGQERVGERGSG